MHCKICTKGNGLSKGLQGRNIKILFSVDIMVFKITKWPTCVYMIKNIRHTVVIYFNQATKAEDRIVAMILCLVRSTCYLSPRVRNTCTEIWELSGYITVVGVFWLYYITALRALRPSKKS